MKIMKYSKPLSLILAAALLLSGCGSLTAQKPETPPAVERIDNTGESDDQTKPETEVKQGEDVENNMDRVYVNGPYGRISIELPENWQYMPYSTDSECSNSGSYGMWIRPNNENTGYIDLCYMQMFGVCGTGLNEEETTLAGDAARVGTYDDHEMWDFISFKGKNEGIIAQSVMTEEWPEEERKAVIPILESLEFDPDDAEGAVSYFKNDAEVPEIGIIVDARNITGTGAAVHFRVWDPELAAGELEYGDHYSLEKLEGEEWTQVPVIFEGEWTVNDIAYIIPKDQGSEGSKWEVDWEWLYGALTPGDYRICKTVMDWRAPGDYDEYKVYAYFKYAGEEKEKDIPGGWKTAKGDVTETPSFKPAQGIHAVYAEYPAVIPDMDASEFMESDAHWDWWSAYREKLDASNKVQDGMDEYYAAIIQELLVSEDEENKVCSPLNIYVALSMLAEVTDGDSREQILEVLRADSIETLRNRTKALWEANYVDTPSLKTILSDSLWIRDSIHYNDETMQTLADEYYASTFSGQMGSEEMNEALRGWMDENTGGLLKEFTKDLKMDLETVMALVSTIYYKAAWYDTFTENGTDRAVFHGAAGDTQVDMMHGSEMMQVSFGDHFTAVSKGLQDSGGMYFFLPNEDTDVNEVIADPHVLDLIRGDWDGNGEYYEVKLSVPKFKVEAKTDLIDALEHLGINDVLDSSKADFTPLTDEVDEISLSSAEHAALVEIDENGVTGAAYTVLMLAEGAALMEPETYDFILDRPFCFIVTSRDGSILFAGIVNNVNE